MINIDKFPSSEQLFFVWMLSLAIHADAGEKNPAQFSMRVEKFCFLPQEIKEMRK